MSAETTSRSKIIGALALALALSAGLGYWVYQEYFTNDRFIIAASPVDARRALLLYRMDYDRPEPHFRVGVLDLEGGAMAWEKAMPEGLEHGADHGNMVADAASSLGFFVSTRDEEQASHVRAFKLSDGGLAWDRRIDPVKGLIRLRRGPTVVGGDTLLVAGPGEAITGLDTKTGEVRWKTPTIRYLHSIDPLTVTLENGDIHTLDPKTGAARVRAGDPRGPLCHGQGRASWLTRAKEEDAQEAWRLRSADLATGEERAPVMLPASFHVDKASFDECGVHDGALILTRSVYHGDKAPKGTPHREFLIDAIDLESGSVRWSARWPDVYTGTDIQQPKLEGELTRYVPLVVSKGEDLASTKRQWLILDLKTGETHAKGSFEDDRGVVELWSWGTRWVVRSSLGGTWKLLGVFDGETGEIVRAWKIKGLIHERYHGWDKDLWGHSRWAWTRVHNMAWFRFAAPSFDITERGNPRLEAIDVTDMVRKAFGR